jgi:hypothetical protein
MSKLIRNLIPVSHVAHYSPPFSILPGGAPVLVRLIPRGEPIADGRLPACAQARIQQLNSLGVFSDLCYIGAGRDLAALLQEPGDYQVITPGAPSEELAYGVDLVSATFAMAPPSESAPGEVRACPHAYPNTYCATCVEQPCPIGLGSPSPG